MIGITDAGDHSGVEAGKKGCDKATTKSAVGTSDEVYRHASATDRYREQVLIDLDVVVIIYRTVRKAKARLMLD